MVLPRRLKLSDPVGILPAVTIAGRPWRATNTGGLLAAERRTRGMSTQPQWERAPRVAVIAWELDLSADVVMGHRWGKGTPGRILSALTEQCAAAGGALVKAATYTTALSPHCLCGRRDKRISANAGTPAAAAAKTTKTSSPVCPPPPSPTPTRTTPRPPA